MRNIYDVPNAKRGKQVRDFYMNKANTGRQYRTSHCKGCLVDTRKKGKANNKAFINVLMTSLKSSAKKRGDQGRLACSEFTLTIKDILELKKTQNNLCVLSGKELIWERKSGFNQASVDRIDNNKGYIKDNIQLVCFKINRSRSDLEIDEFIELCRSVVNYADNNIGDYTCYSKY